MATLGEKVGEDGRKTYQHRSGSLFQAVDSDGSGQIDKEEFGKLYDLIKVEVQAELDKEAALEKSAAKAKRMTKMMGMLAAVLLGVLALSVAANFAVMYTVADQMKDTKVDANDQALTTRSGKAVGTGQMQEKVDNMLELPGLNSAYYYNGIKHLTLTNGGEQKGYQISSWTWKSSRSMFFSFHDGSDLLIHEGNIHHLNTTAVVTFDPAGTPSTHADVDVVDVTAATAKCADLGCPTSKCAVALNMMGLASATCNGFALWDYKNEPVPNAIATRRKMPLINPVTIWIGRAVVTWAARKIMRGSQKVANGECPEDGCKEGGDNPPPPDPNAGEESRARALSVFPVDARAS